MLFASLSALGATASCKEPTEVVIVALTNVVEPSGTMFIVGTGADETESRARSFYPAAVTDRLDGPGTVGTLVTTPPSAKDDRLSVLLVMSVSVPLRQCVDGIHQEGCIFARRALRYVPGRALHLPIRLDLDCLGMPCDARSTCHRQRCISSEATCDPDGSCALAGAQSGPSGGEVDAAANPSVDPDTTDAANPPNTPVGDGAANDAADGAANDAGQDAGQDAGDMAGQSNVSSIQCGPTVCSAGQVCCTGASGQTCLPLKNPCPNPTDARLLCDDPIDCEGAAICCLSGGAKTFCRTSCFPSEQVVCSSTSDCAPVPNSICTGGQVVSVCQ